MKVLIAVKEVEVREQVDVLVVGGGPAGIGAAVSAARTGGRVLLLEKRAFLGGNITSAYVESCNWFLNNTLFSVHGLYKEIEDRYKAEYGRGHEIRDYAPFRFNGEYLKIFLDELMARENVKVLFYSFVNDVVIENNRIKAVIIQTKRRRGCGFRGGCSLQARARQGRLLSAGHAESAACRGGCEIFRAGARGTGQTKSH